MPRKRKVSLQDLQMSARDVFINLGQDPLTELLNYAMEKITLEDGEVVPLLVAKIGWVKAAPLLVDILKFSNELLRPKLRSTESHGTQEHIYNITVRQFGPLAEKPVTLRMRDTPVLPETTRITEDTSTDAQTDHNPA